MRSSPVTRWKVANVLVFLVVLAANGAAGSGAMSGESIGLIANRFRSDFLPANYVFGIWSLIYLWLGVFTVYQALPGEGSSDAVRRIGPWWLVSGVLNIAWVSAFSFSQFGLAMMVMAALLVTLIALAVQVQRIADDGGAVARWRGGAWRIRSRSTWRGSPWRSSPTPSSTRTWWSGADLGSPSRPGPRS